MENITIRTATLHDLETLLLFEQGIIKTERPYDPTLKRGEIHYYDLAEMIAAEDVEVVVAEMDGEIIASGYSRIENAKDYSAHQRHCYLGFMYVKPDHRGRGVNNLILDVLKQWVKQQGIAEMRLEVYHQNANAIKAYEKAGFEPYLLQMRTSI